METRIKTWRKMVHILEQRFYISRDVGVSHVVNDTVIEDRGHRVVVGTTTEQYKGRVNDDGKEEFILLKYPNSEMPSMLT